MPRLVGKRLVESVMVRVLREPVVEPGLVVDLDEATRAGARTQVKGQAVLMVAEPGRRDVAGDVVGEHRHRCGAELAACEAATRGLCLRVVVREALVCPALPDHELLVGRPIAASHSDPDLVLQALFDEGRLRGAEHRIRGCCRILPGPLTRRHLVDGGSREGVDEAVARFVRARDVGEVHPTHEVRHLGRAFGRWPHPPQSVGRDHGAVPDLGCSLRVSRDRRRGYR